MSANSQTCPQCGTQLKPGVPGGLCLSCLLSLGLKAGAADSGDSAEPAVLASPLAPTADEFDRFRVIDQIGEGGCGVVYRAEQLRPVRREVALKVIKLGMDTGYVIARFEAERQALALMDHPGIAKVFDAGTSYKGRPFFAMELVSGERITDYCDRQQLSIAARLELFARVCEAVQHAHQKGIIHRDLKPSNILVTEHDGVAQPKVIDFGIAKATSRQRLADQTVYTAFDQFVGTPAYMSPEQAGATGEDVDTRSDIYSLGVLLYELLTSHPPFEPERLRQAAVDEVFRIIRDEDPARPSARLTTLSAPELSEIASRRLAAPPKLVREVRGDLDWVVMKALEKLPARRYETANALAVEVRRHLNHEPVSARPPSAAYRFQKMVRRNRLAVIAGMFVTVSLVAGVLVSTWRFLREKEALQQAVAAQHKATAQARRSDHVARLLKEVLAGAGLAVERGRDTAMLRELLDRAAERLDSDLKDDPEVEAELRETIGRAYYDLRDLDKAEAMHRANLRLRQSLFSETNTATADVMMDLAVVLNTKAGAQDLIEAEALFRPVLELRRQQYGAMHLEVAKMLQLLGSNLWSQRKPNEPEALFREALDIRIKLQGEDSPALVTCLEALALCLAGNPGRQNEVENYVRRAAAIHDRSPNRESLARIENLALLGTVLRTCGKPAEAELAVREAIALRRKLYGAEHETLPPLLSSLAIALSDQGKSVEAEPAIREAIVLQRKYRGPEHPHLANFLLNTLVKILIDQQKWAEAEAIGRELIPLIKKVSPHRLLARLDALHLLGIAHLNQSHWVEAEQVFRESLELCERPLESGHLSSPRRCARLQRLYGEALLRQGKYAEAESTLLAANAGLQGSPGKLDTGEYETSMVQLVELCEATNRPADAAEWRLRLADFKKAVDGREK